MESEAPQKAPAGEIPYKPFFNRTLDRVWGIIDERLGTQKWPLRPQPDFSFQPGYWTGSFVATAFIFQVISGILLLFYYVPSTNPAPVGSLYPVGAPLAWGSTYYIIHTVPLGWFLISTHLYGAYATIFLAFLHFFRGFYTGVYKKPREFTWMIGTLLLLSMLGMGFTGYLLPYTALSVGATDVGIVLTLSVPGGTTLAPLILGNATDQALLSRMFALHVVGIPLALGGLLMFHVLLFETHGIAPKASSDPKAKRVLTEHDDKKMGKFFPKVFLYMMKWAFFYAGLLFFIVAIFPWELPVYYGSAQAGGSSPEPDWYFLWLYKVMDFQGVTPILAVASVTLLMLFVLFLPWIDRKPLTSTKTHPRDRPVLVVVGNFLAGMFLVLTVWGGVMPGVVIPDTMVAAYLGSILLVNLVVVFALYARYRASYSRRILAREANKNAQK
ncbi:MAG: cytochrome bc complex cytochrome b subunit [Candidatus Thermoplasmatota archaeon]|jgi:quinol-cytochrome oxidoreductase complex cytochrome b subunit|nr:cytochrome bc complex cytochrome b subunit [Candidatus Thermoplasmatota archaeon]MCL5984099.1 cytochrome bc complex cytochrome b subunit [Candidatus Thermoplasmatota archaeon]